MLADSDRLLYTVEQVLQAGGPRIGDNESPQPLLMSGS